MPHFVNNNAQTVFAKLKKRIKESLEQNLLSTETVKVVIIGAGGQAIVGTDTRLFVAKAGYLAGATFGAEVTSWGYKNLLGIQVHKGLTTGGVIIQAPGQSGLDTSYWGSGKGDLWKAPNAIPVAGAWDQVRAAVAELQQLIDTAHSPQAAPSGGAASVADEIKKLSELRDSGALTNSEFAAAKQRLLGG
jgi:Short C-terminal domain